MEGEHEVRQQERKKEEVWRLSTGTDRKGEGRGVEGEDGDRQQERKKEEEWRVSTGIDRIGRRKRCGG